MLGNADDGAPLTAFGLANPGQAFYLFTNPVAARRQYDAVQLIGRKRDDRRWQMQASYTWSRSVGMERERCLSIRDGFAWGRQVIVRNLPQGQALVRAEPSGTRRLPPTKTLDLRVEHTQRVGGRIQIGLFVDAFNLMNRGVPDSSSSVPVIAASGPQFGTPTAWTDPRLFRVAVRMSF